MCTLFFVPNSGTRLCPDCAFDISQLVLKELPTWISGSPALKAQIMGPTGAMGATGMPGRDGVMDKFQIQMLLTKLDEISTALLDKPERAEAAIADLRLMVNQLMP